MFSCLIRVISIYFSAKYRLSIFFSNNINFLLLFPAVKLRFSMVFQSKIDFAFLFFLSNYDYQTLLPMVVITMYNFLASGIRLLSPEAGLIVGSTTVNPLNS